MKQTSHWFSPINNGTTTVINGSSTVFQAALAAAAAAAAAVPPAPQPPAQPVPAAQLVADCAALKASLTAYLTAAGLGVKVRHTTQATVTHQTYRIPTVTNETDSPVSAKHHIFSAHFDTVSLLPF